MCGRGYRDNHALLKRKVGFLRSRCMAFNYLEEIGEWFDHHKRFKLFLDFLIFDGPCACIVDMNLMSWDKREDCRQQVCHLSSFVCRCHHFHIHLEE